MATSECFKGLYVGNGALEPHPPPFLYLYCDPLVVWKTIFSCHCHGQGKRPHVSFHIGNGSIYIKDDIWIVVYFLGTCMQTLELVLQPKQSEVQKFPWTIERV
jgi:hypothetical protein